MYDHIPDLDVAEPMPLVHDIDEAPAHLWLDIVWMNLLHDERTGGGHALTYDALPEGWGAPPQTHDRRDEHFYVLDGEITFILGGKGLTTRKGDFVFVPCDTLHAFRVDSRSAAFLYGHTPAGLETTVSHFEAAAVAPPSTCERAEA